MIFIEDYVLFAIPTWIFIAQVLGGLAIAAGSAYIVTIPQPKPSHGLWALGNVDRASTGRRAAR